jgi:hypothetical protein
MIKKQLYTFNSTLKQNMLLNHYRCYGDVLDNEQRVNNIYNSIREDSIDSVYLQTENYDKYFNTRFIDFIKSTNSYIKNINDVQDLFDDEDYYDED